MARRNLVIANGGGPTPVINRSNIGIIEGALEFGSDKVDQIFCAVGGTEGLLKGDLINITERMKDPDFRRLVANTPSTYFKTGRRSLKSEDEAKRIFDLCKEKKIGYLFLVGGDDTLKTLNTLSEYAQKLGDPDLPNLFDVPKTIDNDLPYSVPVPESGAVEGEIVRGDQIMCIDFCPGFGTAATFVANKVLELAVEACAFKRHYLIEVMGRNAGFLTAASVAVKRFGYGPHYIAVPERPMDVDRFIEYLLKRHYEHGWGVYVISEGVRDVKTGELISAGDYKDQFGNPLLGGVAEKLAGKAMKILQEQYEKRGEKIERVVRWIKLGELQRVSREHPSIADQQIAYQVGRKAAYSAIVEDKTGFMATIVRQPWGGWQFGLVRTSLAAGVKRSLPERYLLSDPSTGEETISEDYATEYLEPIIGEIVPVVPPIS